MPGMMEERWQETIVLHFQGFFDGKTRSFPTDIEFELFRYASQLRAEVAALDGFVREIAQGSPGIGLNTRASLIIEEIDERRKKLGGD